MGDSSSDSESRTSDFANRLGAELQRFNITQLAVAQRLGISPGTVSGWFNRGYTPQPRILFDLAEMLGVRPEWLLEGREPKLNEFSQSVGEQVIKTLPTVEVKERILYSPEHVLSSPARGDVIPAPTPPVQKNRLGEQSKEVGNTSPYPKDLKMIPLLSWAQAGIATDFDQIPDHLQDLIPAVVHTSRAFAVQLRGDSMEKQFSEGDVAICLPPDIPPRHGDLVVANVIDEGIVFKILNLVDGDPTRIRLKSYNPLYDPRDYSRDAFNWICAVQSVNKLTRK